MCLLTLPRREMKKGPGVMPGPSSFAVACASQPAFCIASFRSNATSTLLKLFVATSR